MNHLSRFIQMVKNKTRNKKSSKKKGELMINPVYYLSAFGLAFLVALLMTPLSKKFAYKIGAVDQPKSRGMHKKPMPLAGGTAIIAGFYFSIILVSFFSSDLSLMKVVGLLVGGIVISILGLLDDLHDLSAKLRFIIQIVVAIFVVASGVYIKGSTLPIIGYVDFKWMGYIITVVWIVGVTNAFNWIDGLDGLATGISSIASLFLMFLAIMNIGTSGPLMVILAAALAGSCLGFLPHNFNPATIFMGSTGSTFLGFTLAVMSIQGNMKSHAALIIAGLILGLPVFDTLFAIARRILSGKSIVEADKGHIHHRLIAKGYSHKGAVITLYVISGLFGIAGVVFAKIQVTLAILIVAFLLYILLKGSIKMSFYEKDDEGSDQPSEESK